MRTVDRQNALEGNTMKLTTAQRQFLTNARDHGNAAYYRKPQVGGCTMPWTANRDLACRKLVAAGLLTSGYEITEAGTALLG
jgi:hypothetical protein